MRNQKGFTLMELMIGMLILGMAIAGALSLFIFQSKRGHESFRDKTTDERVFATLALISRDIQQAGFGVSADHAKLALHVKTTSGSPDALYVSYSDYLSLQYLDRATDLTFLRMNTIWCDRCLDAPYQGFVKLVDPSRLVLQGIPQRSSNTLNGSVGAVLADTTPTSKTTPPVSVEVDVKATTAVVNPSVLGTQDWTFPFVTSSSLAPNTIVVPAVSYRMIKVDRTESFYGSPKTVSYYSLWRNRGSDANPYGEPLLGWDPTTDRGDKFMNLVDFKVRRQYTGGSWDTGGDPANVRLVEISLSYQVNKGTGGATSWGSTVKRTLRISPRNLAFVGL
ncbi:PilW family protein [Desulfomonile tiedjei]|uniref:Prepilin-type N-terminal cleavage/methylation domain-containing protein n=1 Tax=Desulfomonile tiedjei (strain ATCC 49306 / DSM 6799 / DCB-1) TaxID=706587 RepID=I4C8B5_DESTA|nr:prepilin-type N-terminal cleavage/methylation domain-containing protein [Desulfomonile tiedjei]AFM25806.1 prepilin-type N-terminal cleavage/methylation domain-containing protein [Desulfomonile tiedjei DSM 6799]